MKNKKFLLSIAIIFNMVLVFIVWGLVMVEKVDSTSSSTGILEIVSVNPARAHRVAAGATTTFVLTVNNPGPDLASAQIAISSLTEGWRANLSKGDTAFQPTDEGGSAIDFPLLGEGQEKGVVVSVSPMATMQIGQIGTIEISATLSSGLTGSAILQAIVNNKPKVYFLSLDGISTQYVMLGRHGQPNPVPNDRLMPTVREFLAEAAWFPKARCSLPSSTDMNMFGLYSGSWPGTAGLPYVTNYFKGWDGEGDLIKSRAYPEDLRFGPDGLPVLSIFDVAKDPAYGGDPDTFVALISGKFQIDNLFRDESLETDLDILADGQWYPYYLTPPQIHVLGDPSSDPNAARDRDGVNIYPTSEFRMHTTGYGLAGENPSWSPSDRWVAGSAMRIIAAEDPDVFAVHLGNIDKIHHGAGAADQPDEWIDPGTPDIMWDDINIYNSNANREPVLDVIFEADTCIKEILNTLERRDVMDESIIVLASDHSAVTYMNDQLNIIAHLNDVGLGDTVRLISAYGEVCIIFLWDQRDANAIEAALESFIWYHPVQQQEVRPFVCIKREEMCSGIDSVLGRFTRNGGPLRSEMYSEWLIDHPAEDNSKVVWPDMFVYTGYRYQIRNLTELPHLLGGHGGLSSESILFAIKGPAFAQGTFDKEDTSLVDAVPTVYEVLGWTPPGNVDGRKLMEILPEL